jgi:hypothetical protein
MKKIYLFACFLFMLPQFVLSQQCQLEELKSYLSAHNLFTERMIYKGNTMITNSSRITYGYIKKDGAIGASVLNPLNEGDSIENFVQLTETEYLNIKFAEEYREEEKTARTWYTLQRRNVKKEFIGTSPIGYHAELYIQYADKSDYTIISKAIISNSVYIKSEDNFDGGYNHIYKSGEFTFILDTKGRISIEKNLKK